MIGTAHLEAACGQPPLSWIDVPFWLVGGCVRDALLGRESADWDILVARDAPGTARRLADRIGGSFVPLDEERSIARVVTSERLTVDVCEFVGGTLESDLQRRDFTVNAIAFDGKQLVNVTSDLKARLLRTCSPNSLPDDPLRVLRAFRFMRELGFGLAPGLEEELAAHTGGLERVAAERVRDELFRILRAGLTPIEEVLVRTGVLPEVLPAYSTGGLAALTELDALQPDPWLAGHLHATLAGDRRRLEVLKLAALHWHCRGESHEPQRLKADHALSRSEGDYLARVLRPEPKAPTAEEDRYQLYKRLCDCVPDYAVLVASAQPELQEETALWLREYRERSPLAFPPRFLSGTDLHELGIPSGRDMGRILGSLEHAAALGKVRTREEARALADRMRTQA